MQLTTTRASGFFEKTAFRISPISPPLPPMKTWVGSGRSESASGARPLTISIFCRQYFARFCSSNARASCLYSIDRIFPSGQVRAASTLTEPVPAPTSQRTASDVSPRRHRESERISEEVMGAFPRIKALSGSPGTTGQFSASKCFIYRT